MCQLLKSKGQLRSRRKEASSEGLVSSLAAVGCWQGPVGGPLGPSYQAECRLHLLKEGEARNRHKNKPKEAGKGEETLETTTSTA